MKFRIKFASKTCSWNTGYFVRKRKEGFTGCSIEHPEMARVMNKKTLDDVLQFLTAQGEMNYYDFTVEEVKED